MNRLTTETIPDGYKLTFSEALKTPELSYDGSNWVFTEDWMEKTESIRDNVVTLLYNTRTSLFKNSPSRNTLEKLLTPWLIVGSDGSKKFICDLPKPDSTKVGKGFVDINGITIKKAGITPTWLIRKYDETTPVVDFDWNETSSTGETELREITLIESEVPSEGVSVPFRLNTDEEYNARKFAAKERVKEARLKAILARRAAEVETTRYYDEFTNGDNESSFSEYDISDFDEEEDEEEGDVSEA
jgi:hypothetical protein